MLGAQLRSVQQQGGWAKRGSNFTAPRRARGLHCTARQRLLWDFVWKIRRHHTLVLMTADRDVGGPIERDMVRFEK